MIITIIFLWLVSATIIYGAVFACLQSMWADLPELQSRNRSRHQSEAFFFSLTGLLGLFPILLLVKVWENGLKFK